MPQNPTNHRPTTMRAALVRVLGQSCLGIGLLTLACGAKAAALIDEGLDWQRCAQPGHINIQNIALLNDVSVAPIEITADSFEASSLSDQTSFSGNVQLHQDNQTIFAEHLTYNRSSGDINAKGNILIKRADLRITADQAQFNISSSLGQLEQVEYRLPGIMARGTAQRATLSGPNTSNYEKISYTTCRPGNSDWLLNAEQLEIDTEQGLGKAHGAKLTFHGVPLMYLPILSFPIDDQRRSGVLVPKIGYSDNQGLDLAVPYYFNLAANYDLTLTPRVMSKRGVMLSGEFRFLSETTEGVIDASFMPDDSLSTRYTEERGSLSVLTHSQFNQNLSTDLRINHVSDNDFLADFGGNLALTSISHLERAAEVRYDTNKLQALGRLQHFQTLDATLTKADRPYARLPQITLNMQHAASRQPINYAFGAEFVHFVKDGGFVEGRRLDLQPSVSYSKHNDWSYFTPKASVRYTQYSLDNQTPGLDPSPSRLSGIFSLDSGLYYDRSSQYLGQRASQTLEPRLYYLYVPKQDHSDIPIFDTSEHDFNFDNLFRENRFNGADRLGDANQLTLALTSRINDDASGRELLSASIGQILYFKDRNVSLPGGTIDKDNGSAFVGEIAAELGSGWRARGGLQWNPHSGGSGTVDQALAQASYRDSNARIFNASYRLREGVSSQTDIAAIWPISANTSIIGRWNYSLSEQRNLEALAGVEYGSCCWRVRAVIRQHSDSTNNDQNLGFLLQLELNGLGKLGDNIENLLKNGIYGYRKYND